MPVKVFITIDTEEDAWDEYATTHNPVENIAHIPMLQDLFDRYGAVPTYLINWPVVTNKHANHIIRDILYKGKCEIGTHCHPWNTPPFEENINIYNTMLSNLPYELITKKIENLHEEIINDLKVTPVCFRAGKWAFDPKVARSIYNLGYRIDTSVTPFVDWTKEGGVDFSKAPSFAYRFDPDDVLHEKENGCLLEVPPTIGFFQKNFQRCNIIRKWILEKRLSSFHLLGILDKLRILNFRCLSPELSSGSDMIRLSTTFIRLGYDFLNMSFHSTSLLPGKSPFVHNLKHLEKFLNTIEMFLKFAVDQGMTFLPLSKAVEVVK